MWSILVIVLVIYLIGYQPKKNSVADMIIRRDQLRHCVKQIEIERELYRAADSIEERDNHKWKIIQLVQLMNTIKIYEE